MYIYIHRYINQMFTVALCFTWKQHCSFQLKIQENVKEKNTIRKDPQFETLEVHSW